MDFVVPHTQEGGEEDGSLHSSGAAQLQSESPAPQRKRKLLTWSDTRRPIAPRAIWREQEEEKELEKSINITFAPLIEREPNYVFEFPTEDKEEEEDKEEPDSDFSFIEFDLYQRHYANHFHNKAHVNFVIKPPTENETVDPVIVSIRLLRHNETKEHRRVKALIHSKTGWERCSIMVSSETVREVIEKKNYHQLLTSLREIRPNLKDSIYFTPFVDEHNVQLSRHLLKYEQQMISTFYKFGVLYCKDNQDDENDMYSNVEGSPRFEEFLSFLGEKVRLQGFTGYKGGLDDKLDTTGTHSVYTKFGAAQGQECEIMFHISTYLQFYPNDPQQIERKRHLGNDVAVIIFREGNNEPFLTSTLRSQLNHVFIVITPVEQDGETVYGVAVCCKEGVPPFDPPVPRFLRRDEKSRNWLLTKLINGERASFDCPNFAGRFRNVRKGQLDYIIEGCRELQQKIDSSGGTQESTFSSFLYYFLLLVAVVLSIVAFCWYR